MSPRRAVVFLAALALSVGCSRQTWEGEGDLVGVDGGAAIIAPGAVPGVMEASTGRYPARPAALLEGAVAGTRVRMKLVRDGAEVVLVGIEPIGLARGATSAVHDHSPRHGGVVREIEGIHVEIAATPDGRVRIWLTDLWRRPLAVDGTTGTIRLHLPSGDPTLVLAPAGDALEAHAARFEAETGRADVALVRQGARLDASVQLDLTGERAGVTVLPQTGCVPTESAGSARGPRCAIRFGSSFTAIATTDGGAHVITAVTHGATSVWSLPAATLVMGLEPLPPVVVANGAHEPDPRVVTAREDGSEIAVAAGPTMYFYDGRSGRYRRKLDGPGGAIRAAALSPGGSRIALTAAGDGKARVLEAEDGRVVRTLDGEGQVQSVAFDETGRRIVAATDVGTILLASLDGDEPARTLTPSTQSLAVVVFTADRLLAAGDDGAVHVIDPATGAETARVEVGAPVRLLALSVDDRFAATVDAERMIRVHRLPDGAVIERLAFHPATIGVLAWGEGPTLVSGDNDGTLAVWDVPEAR